MSKAALATVTIFVCLTIPKLHSQDFPRVELFGGYSYLSFRHVRRAHCPRYNSNHVTNEPERMGYFR